MTRLSLSLAISLVLVLVCLRLVAAAPLGVTGCELMPRVLNHAIYGSVAGVYSGTTSLPYSFYLENPMTSGDIFYVEPPYSAEVWYYKDSAWQTVNFIARFVIPAQSGGLGDISDLFLFTAADSPARIFLCDSSTSPDWTLPPVIPAGITLIDALIVFSQVLMVGFGVVFLNPKFEQRRLLFTLIGVVLLAPYLGQDVGFQIIIGWGIVYTFLALWLGLHSVVPKS